MFLKAICDLSPAPALDQLFSKLLAIVGDLYQRDRLQYREYLQKN